MADFSVWLHKEANTTKYALIQLYEKRDELLYTDAPMLRQEYLEKIGYMETPVLASELEATLLKRKLELMQAAVNRREAIDMAQIDEQLSEIKKSMMSQAEESDRSLLTNPLLTQEEQSELKRMYHRIIGEFHPSVNIGMTEIQKELYNRAVDAYRRKCLDSLKLAYDMLFSGEGIELTLSLSEKEMSEGEKARQASYELASDYTLAKQLYDCFMPLEADMTMSLAIGRYKEQLAALSHEIESIQREFPFSARELMNNPSKLSVYAEELRMRMRQSELDKSELTEKIERLLEVASR